MKSTPYVESLHHFVTSHFGVREAALLDQLGPAAQKAGLPPIQIGDDQAALVGWLLRMAGAKRALDVGTLFGYSAATMALAMGPKGVVVTLEREPRHAAVARENLAQLRLGPRVRLVEGDALKVMRAEKGSSFDAILVDADKEGYPAYVQEAHRLLSAGGLLLVDNAFAWGHVAAPAMAPPSRRDDVKAIRTTLDAVAKDKRWDAALIPIGDGLLVARKVRKTR